MAGRINPERPKEFRRGRSEGPGLVGGFPLESVIHLMDENKKWYYNRWFVIVLLLSVGPFGFYNLWKSPEFSKKAKGAITSAVIILTVALIVGAELAYQMLMNAFTKQLGGF